MWANAVVMVRPTGIEFNPETAADNVFQARPAEPLAAVRAAAAAEFQSLVAALQSAGIAVHVADPPAGEQIPDAVFPNNWFSTAADGRVVVYPLAAANRRRERRFTLFDELERAGYAVRERIDLSGWEAEQLYLEGTGSLVLDRQARLAFAALSPRTSATALARWCRLFEYRPILFQAAESLAGEQVPVYHTNVVLSLGEGWAVLGAELIADPQARRDLQRTLEQTGREVLAIDAGQVRRFAGNILQLESSGPQRGVLALSATALAAFTPQQLQRLEARNRLVVVDIGTIERCGGGSVRCMLAENFLPRG